MLLKYFQRERIFSFEILGSNTFWNILNWIWLKKILTKKFYLCCCSILLEKWAMSAKSFMEEKFSNVRFCSEVCFITCWIHYDQKIFFSSIFCIILSFLYPKLHLISILVEKDMIGNPIENFCHKTLTGSITCVHLTIQECSHFFNLLVKIGQK